MDAIVSLELDRIEAVSALIGKRFKGDMSGVFSDEIVSFIESELKTIISVVKDKSCRKSDKMIRIAKAFGRISGTEKTMSCVIFEQFGGATPYSVNLLIGELQKIQNSITRIMMNL